MEKNNDTKIWEEKKTTGVLIIDRQHEKLVKMVNSLYSYSLDENMDNSRFLKGANELINFLKFHLNTEERLMMLLEYRDYANHKKLHRNFLKDIIGRTKQSSTREQFDLKEFFTILRNEGTEHFNVHDKAFIDYYINLKESGALTKNIRAEQSNNKNSTAKNSDAKPECA
jgi:hemerythrin-like metal-binding protein